MDYPNYKFNQIFESHLILIDHHYRELNRETIRYNIK